MSRKRDAYDDGFGTWVTGTLIVIESLVGLIWWAVSVMMVVALGHRVQLPVVTRPATASRA